MSLGGFYFYMILAVLGAALVGGIVGSIAWGIYNVMTFCFSLGKRAITWPFRTLWYLIFPQKKKKEQSFYYVDDDIEIHF